jgi:hypothetical protein
MGAFIVKRAKGRFACWDLIRRLRNPPQAVAVDTRTLCDHFDEVFHSSTAALVLSLDQLGIHPPPDFAPTPFSDAELCLALQKLNAQAATGPQRVASRYSKQIFQNDEARVPLLLLMNSCLVEGSVPVSWGDSVVFILYKGKGDRSLPTNYRFINLNNDFLRIYERLLQLRFNQWLEMEKPWGPMQFGFMSGVGTEDAFLCLRTLALTMTRSKRVPCYANFLDLKKAFPSIDRVQTLQALFSAGVPFELVRAFASTFSGNFGRLVVNGELTQPAVVNKGTKEGGINSPSIFNTAYAIALSKLDIHEFPESEVDISTDKVYYLAFADDLVLISGNLSKLERVTNQLQAELAKLGMSINGDKTKWMMFLPQDPLVIPNLDDLQLRLGNQQLEMVQEFVYLGFTIDCMGSVKSHVQKREKLMITAATTAGKLMRQLEVTNMRSLRAYFHSLVGSQLYSHTGAIFSNGMYVRAQKIFLQTAFNLPSSFPLRMASWLLDSDDLELIILRSRIRFLRHLLSSNNADASLRAMIMDRASLLPRRVGWNYDFFAGVPSLPQLRDMDLTSLSGMDSAIANLTRILRARRVDELCASSLSHLPDLFPGGRIPRSFGDHLGSMSFEPVRAILLFLGNLTRFSFTRIPNPPCPLCTGILYSFHLFDCVRLQDFEDESFTWEDLVRFFISENWRESITMVFRRFRRWSGIADIFRTGFRDNVDFYFQEIQHARRNVPLGLLALPAAGQGSGLP